MSKPCKYRSQLEAAGSWARFVRDRTAARLAGEDKPNAEDYLPGGPKFVVMKAAGSLKPGVKYISQLPGDIEDKEAEEFLACVGGIASPGDTGPVAPTPVEAREEAPASAGCLAGGGEPAGKASLLTKAFEAIGGFERLVRHLRSCQLGSRELSSFYGAVFEEDALKSGRQFQDAGAEADEVIESLLAEGPSGLLLESSVGSEGERGVAEMGEGDKQPGAAGSDVDGV